MIDDIADDSERLLGVVENLLLLTRLESGSHPDPEPQVLGHIIRKSIKEFRHRQPRREVTLTSQPPRHLVVEVDRTYLDLLIDTLLGNADKYSPPETEVELAIRSEREEVHVVVLDRGIGVSEEEAAEMFAPFYRTEAGKRGAGLSSTNFW